MDEDSGRLYLGNSELTSDLAGRQAILLELNKFREEKCLDDLWSVHECIIDAKLLILIQQDHAQSDDPAQRRILSMVVFIW